MKRWQWGALGVGVALVGLGTWFRKEIATVLTFDPDNFLPDKIMVPYRPFDISRFLEAHKSYLLHVQPGGMPLAALIDQATARAGVSPMWILLRLQAEQGLVTMTDESAAKSDALPKTWKERDTSGQMKTVSGTALEYRLRWAVGYAAFEDGFQPIAFGKPMAGIDNQIRELAAWTGRHFPQEQAKLGRPISVDGKVLNPKTAASRVAYLYTPHVYGAKDNYGVARSLFPEVMGA